MARQSLLFSFVMSLLSISVLAYFPIERPISEGESTHSPYHEEIMILTDPRKNTITADELKRLDELSAKNNQWLEDHQQENINYQSEVEDWKNRATVMAPVIMVIWGLSYFWFSRKVSNGNVLLVLVFPVVLTILQLLPVLTLSLIAFSVVAVWFWFVWRHSVGGKGESL